MVESVTVQEGSSGLGAPAHLRHAHEERGSTCRKKQPQVGLGPTQPGCWPTLGFSLEPIMSQWNSLGAQLAPKLQAHPKESGKAHFNDLTASHWNASLPPTVKSSPATGVEGLL